MDVSILWIAAGGAAVGFFLGCLLTRRPPRYSDAAELIVEEARVKIRDKLAKERKAGYAAGKKGATDRGYGFGVRAGVEAARRGVKAPANPQAAGVWLDALDAAADAGAPAGKGWTWILGQEVGRVAALHSVSQVWNTMPEWATNLRRGWEDWERGEGVHPAALDTGARDFAFEHTTAAFENWLRTLSPEDERYMREAVIWCHDQRATEAREVLSGLDMEQARMQARRAKGMLNKKGSRKSGGGGPGDHDAVAEPQPQKKKQRPKPPPHMEPEMDA